ncbi:MAG: exo-alpha-sialidase [Planctomycetes bacterium]|nr:exo-alpha-sialidase [Planctomycetota bacterium]
MLPLLLLSLAPAGEPPAFPVKPTEVRKMFADGKHNAFTAFVKFKGTYLLAFRTAKEHNSADGDIVVLKSADAKEWTEALKLDIDKRDDRDPQLLVVADKLIMYVASMKGPDLTTYAVTTEDGKTWSKPKAVYEEKYIVWKPIQYGKLYYSGAHKKDEVSGGKGREVHFIKSSDGIAWEKVSTIRAGNWESETTLHFEKDGTCFAFLRQKYGSPQAQILEAKAPYKEWKNRPTDVTHFSGHSVRTYGDVTYLFSRDRNGPPDNRYGQVIYTFADGKLAPYSRFPAGGDCAYAEAVRDGDNMLVSYYSTHEKQTNIYLAVVPLKK